MAVFQLLLVVFEKLLAGFESLEAPSELLERVVFEWLGVAFADL